MKSICQCSHSRLSVRSALPAWRSQRQEAIANPSHCSVERSTSLVGRAMPANARIHIANDVLLYIEIGIRPTGGRKTTPSGAETQKYGISSEARQPLSILIAILILCYRVTSMLPTERPGFMGTWTLRHWAALDLRVSELRRRTRFGIYPTLQEFSLRLPKATVSTE